MLVVSLAPGEFRTPCRDFGELHVTNNGPVPITNGEGFCEKLRLEVSEPGGGKKHSTCVYFIQSWPGESCPKQKVIMTEFLHAFF